MSEYSPRRLAVASTLAFSLLAGAADMPHDRHAELTPDDLSSGCLQPDESDYQAVDRLLAEDTGQLVDLAIEDGTMAANHDFWEGLAHISGTTDPGRMVRAEVMDAFDNEQAGIEMFRLAGRLAQEHYGVTIELADETVLADDAPQASADATVLRLPVDLQHITGPQVLAIADSFTALPPQIYEAFGVESFEYYAVPDGDDGGFVRENGTVHQNIDVSERSVNQGTSIHETGHLSDRFFCTDPNVDQVFTGHNGGNIYTDEKYIHPGQPSRGYSLEAYMARNRTAINNIYHTSDADTFYDEVELSFTANDPTANEITTASQYGLTSPVEDKAEIYKAMFERDGFAPLDSVMDPSKPRLAAKARELLARWYSAAPEATAYLIRRYGKNFYAAPDPNARVSTPGSIFHYAVNNQHEER